MSIFLVLIETVLLLMLAAPAGAAEIWSAGERDVLRSLWIGSLPPPPPDPSNAYADNPDAVRLGKMLYHDARFSANERVSCLTCHRADTQFSDNLPLAHGICTTPRRSMPLVGIAYSPRFFWDGRKDSLWSQALGPCESPVEHGFTRTRCVILIGRNYRREYEAVFGPLPRMNEKAWPAIARPASDDPAALKAWLLIPRKDRESITRVYANMGKAIAAYERTILPGPAPFDRYVEALLREDTRGMEQALGPRAEAGLRLFIGKANCIQCHHGPLFTDHAFHNLGVPDPPGLPPDPGRTAGITALLADEFNCLGEYSDARESDCIEIRRLDTDAARYAGAFKTPTLRGVAARPPYLHSGRAASLRDAILFHLDEKNSSYAHERLAEAELIALESFLRTLTGPISEFEGH